MAQSPENREAPNASEKKPKEVNLQVAKSIGKVAINGGKK